MKKKSGIKSSKDKEVAEPTSIKGIDSKERDNFLSNIPEEKLIELGLSKEDLTKFESVKSFLHYEGVFPPPWILKGYEEVLPGSPDRIFKLTENNAAHRINRTDKKLEIERRNSLLGLVLGFIIALVFLSGSVYLIATGKEVSGTIIGTLDLVSLVSVFVVGSKLRKDERMEKMRDIRNLIKIKGAVDSKEEE